MHCSYEIPSSYPAVSLEHLAPSPSLPVQSLYLTTPPELTSIPAASLLSLS